MNRSRMFSPVVARSRLLAIASSRTIMMRSCAMLTAPQICRQGFGSRTIAAPIKTPTTTMMIARLRRAVVASAWRGAANDCDDSVNDQPAVGRIEIITGPMFSGKSTELLRRAAEHEVSFFCSIRFFFSASPTSTPRGTGKKSGKRRNKPDLDHLSPSHRYHANSPNRPPGAASPWSRAPRTPDTAFPRS